MKKSVFYSFLLCACLTIAGCVKEDHKVCFRNNYSKTLYDVSAGSARFGNVLANSTSDYKSINTGNFSISGHTLDGQFLSGSGSVSGKGKHKWTITLSATGQLSMSKD